MAESGIGSGKLEVGPDGYEYYFPTEEEHKHLAECLSMEIEQALKDHEPFFEKKRRAMEAYRGLPQTLGSDPDTPVLTLPIIARLIDQIVAWELAQTFRAKPIVSIDPFFLEKHEILVPTTVDAINPLTGQPEPMETLVPLERTSEDLGAAYETAYDWKFREKLGGFKLLEGVYRERKIYGFSVVKTVYDKRTRKETVQKIRKTPQGFIEVVGTEEREIADGEAVRHYPVSIFNFLMPMDESDVQKSRWIAEYTPVSSSILRDWIGRGDAPLLRAEDLEGERGIMKKGRNDWMGTADKALRTSIDGRTAMQPSQKHRVFEVRLDHPVRLPYIDDEGNEKRRYVVLQLCGELHLDQRKFLRLYREPYPKRPYTIFFDQNETHRFATSSLCERLMVHQALASQMLHLDIQNAVQANNRDILCDPQSEAWDVLKNTKRRPGRLIPRGSPEDVEYVQAGVNHTGLLDRTNFVMADANDAANVSAYESGSSIPSRTPAASIAQIMQAGYLRPLVGLMSASESFGEMVRLYFMIHKRFVPFGEVVPVQDPETREILSIPMRYPVEPIFDGYRIALTAADEAMAQEADKEQLAMLNQQLSQAWQELVQIASAAADPMASPALTELYKNIFEAKIEATKLLLEQRRVDKDKFLPDRQVFDALVAEKQQILAMQQMQQEMMGAMGGEAVSEGSMEAGIDANAAEPMGGMAGAPDNGGNIPFDAAQPGGVPLPVA